MLSSLGTAVGKVVEAAVAAECYQATKIISPKLTVKATRRHKLHRGDDRTEFVITFGAPNYRERNLIKVLKKVGEPFPIKKVLLRYKPKVKQV